MINNKILKNLHTHRETFINNKPFRHLALDDFLETKYAKNLLKDFPPFEDINALNEFKKAGGKAVVQNITTISSFYKSVYEYISSSEFLKTISTLTSIPDLIFDPGMYGGGTHENIDGQELDAHVDFNYLSSQKLHRRLNILIYLNEEWDENWGGAIEIHSNPRDPVENKILSFSPIFNRCVLFETNEYSWHGFPRINLPEDKKHLSRKSLSIYLYTKERQVNETAPCHSTFYVQRPLPEHIKPGYALKGEDIVEINNLLTKRDNFIEYYQNMELVESQKQQSLVFFLKDIQSRLRVPATGYVLQILPVKNFWHDDWVAPGFELQILPQKLITGIEVNGFVTDHSPKNINLLMTINGGQPIKYTIKKGSFRWSFNANLKQNRPHKIYITGEPWLNCKRDGLSNDDRDLLFVLSELRFK